jgi:large subunit ribosomal protein L22
MAYKYSRKECLDNQARAAGLNLDVSTKQCVEICKYLRNKTLQDAKAILEAVILKKRAIPFPKYTEGAGHKKGIGPGKYPVKAASLILKIFKSVEANAQTKGLSSNLKIVHMNAHQAARPWHYGRLRRVKMKRTHVEVIVQEIGRAEPRKKQVKETEKAAPKEKPIAEEEAKNEAKAPAKEKASKKEEPARPKKEPAKKQETPKAAKAGNKPEHKNESAEEKTEHNKND